MEVSVNLQEPFSYSIIPMIVIIILTFVIAIYIIVKACNKVRKEKTNITKIIMIQQDNYCMLIMARTLLEEKD